MMNENFQFKISAGPHNRYFCPVELTIPTEQFDSSKSKCLKELHTGRLIPIQIVPTSDKSQAKIAWLVDELRAYSERHYAVVDGSPGKGAAGVSLIENKTESALEIYIDNQFFTRYNFDKNYSKPFLYPIIGPYGANITRHYPMKQNVPGETTDHIHHRSIYTSHGDMNGSDNWSEEEGHGHIVHTKIMGCLSGTIFGEFIAENEWQNASGQPIVREQRRIRAYWQPSDRRILDYEVTFFADWEDVRFGDTKEGGILSVRVASSMDAVKDGRIENAHGGVSEAETWGKRAVWCDYSGPVEDRWQGIALFDHPDNFRHPTYWHVRDYGLMTANPFGLSHFKNDKTWDGSYVLKKGGSLRFLYRIYIHSGNVQDGGVKERYFDFIHPIIRDKSR